MRCKACNNILIFERDYCEQCIDTTEEAEQEPFIQMSEFINFSRKMVEWDETSY